MEVHASLFGIGIGEMLIIAAVALVVIGPERFPEFARIVVRTIRDVRGYVNDAKQELDKELRPITREMRQLEQYQPKRYFDDITNKPKSKPKPSPVSSPDLDEEGGSEGNGDVSSPASEGGAVGEASPEPETAPEEPPATTPYKAPPTESDFDRQPTAFPKKERDSVEPAPEEEEQYRD